MSIKKIYFVAILVAISFSCSKNSKKYQYHEGLIQGTIFHIKYDSENNLNPQIDSLLQEFNSIFSNYDSTSLISKLNNNSYDSLNPIMEKMLNTAFEINKITDGAFDITIAPIANIWHFGWEKDSTLEPPDKELIDSLLRFVGMNKMSIQNHRLIKENPDIKIISNAIAQGLSCDYIAEYFDNLGINNYLIEIGGEVYCKGLNPQGQKWNVGITNPSENDNGNSSSIIVKVQNCSVCTSGNYRKYFRKGDKKFAHSINPKTGYPAENSLLSVTVISNTAMYADAIATAFMVLGLEKSLEIVDSLDNVEAAFIYCDEEGNVQIKYSENFEKNFLNN